MVTFGRFYQDFRDTLMISGIEQKVGNVAGEFFKFMARENLRQVNVLVGKLQ
jgi:hypothetical protein